MRFLILIPIVVLTVIAAVLVDSRPQVQVLRSSPIVGDREPIPNDPASKDWDAFELSALLDKRRETGAPYLPFLDRLTLSMGVYSLGAGAQDRQPVHNKDEVYYIVSGRAVLRVGDEDHPVKQGSVVFVKGGVDHRFHSIEEDLNVLVFFAASSS